MLWVIYFVVFFAAWAMMVREGLWSNSIALVSIIISGLVAFGFYSPLVVWLDEYLEGKYTYFLDYVVIWGLFAVSMVICRSVFRAASATRMRFKHPIDAIGGPLMAVLAAWVLVAFTIATLHTSPMPKNAFGGGLVSANDVDTASAFSSPDAAWLRFVEKMSKPEALGTASTGRFGAKGFVRIYADHREKYEKSASHLVNRS